MLDYESIIKIMRHTFSSKALFYRATAFMYMLSCCTLFGVNPIQSIKLSLSILAGSMLLYGLIEYKWSSSKWTNRRLRKNLKKLRKKYNLK